MTPALNLKNITKRFGSLVANDDISLEVQQGEILALLGENGAGKSTLVSILFGHYVADSGSIEVNGYALKPGDPKAALQAGIGIVHQHFALADNLSVLDNVILGTESLWSFATKKGAARAHLLSASEQFGLKIEPEALVGSLSVGQKQRVEILKALYRGAKILILDEPTAVLTPQESEGLFETLRTLVARGMSIIFISHKLPEVLRVSDRVAVLRHGKLVMQAYAKEVSQQQLAQAMVGYDIKPTVRAELVEASVSPSTSSGRTDRIVCELKSVSAHLTDREQLHEASLVLLSGQITAIAGVSGNGQLALAQLLCGMLPARAGQIFLNGQAAPRGAAAWVQAGVARIPEDRKGTGLVADLPFWENAVSEQLKTRSSPFKRWGFVRAGAARAHAQAIAERFDVRGSVKGRDADLPVARLSGGNMQKLVLGRALLRVDSQSAQLVIAHQPTWGLDVGAVRFVQEQLIVARDAGAAVLLISDDLDEIFEMADQVAVIHAGHLGKAKPTKDWTRESIGLAMAGVSEEKEVFA
ncbi:MAG: ABC transporter ATP-binding protein [Burkholderiales bacterium]|nr:MAG: ABC transporter ATP-binding protein [Burkholderiales bacterium]